MKNEEWTMKNGEAAKMTTDDICVPLWSTIRGYKGEPPIPNLFLALACRMPVRGVWASVWASGRQPLLKRA